MTPPPDLAQLATNEVVVGRVVAAFARANAELAKYEQVRRILILPREWTIEADELTPTLKVRRRIVVDHCSTEIERLYADVVPQGVIELVARKK